MMTGFSLQSLRPSIHATIREHVNIQLLRDGGLKSCEVKGDLDLRISDPAFAKVKLALAAPSPRAADLGRDLQFQQHPNVAKFSSGSADRVIALKDPNRSFPVGQGLGVLRWRLSTKDEGFVPLNSGWCGNLPNAVLTPRLQSTAGRRHEGTASATSTSSTSSRPST